MRHTLFVLLAALLLVAACHQPQKSTELHVAAASDLTNAFSEIGKEFEKTHNVKVTFSFGASGMLTKQIENGAPMDVFAAANVEFVNQLERQGLTIAGTRSIYARGAITLWTRKDSSLKVTKITDLTDASIKRIAIANPDYAPYGMAARDALQSAGIWDQVKPKLVYGENIRQTLQFAQSGNVDVAIMALSLSRESDGNWTRIDDSLHKPLDQAMAVIKATKNEVVAREFCSFVTGAEGRAILQKYGFEFP